MHIKRHLDLALCLGDSSVVLTYINCTLPCAVMRLTNDWVWCRNGELLAVIKDFAEDLLQRSDHCSREDLEW